MLKHKGIICGSIETDMLNKIRSNYYYDFF